MAGRKKGTPKTGGRVKGTPNKINSDIRAMIEEALSLAGGAAYLLEQSRENPAAFLALVGKILPLQVQHSGSVTSYVVAAPPMIEDASAWQQQHTRLPVPGTGSMHD